jgi:hypothetical protein
LNGVGNCGSWYYWDASKAQCCANAGGWVVCGCTAKAGIAFNWHVATIVQVNGFSGLATLLRIGDMAVGDSLLSRAELRFSGPTSVAIENESVDFGSVRASAFGSVTSSSGAGAIHLAPSSPTASGGVRLDLPNHAASAAIALAPIAAASTGGFLDVESEGSIAGAPHALGRVRLAPASSQVACTADFSAVGATDSQITVLDQGAVIAQVASSSLASPALLDAAPSIIVIWSSGGGIHARFEGVVNVLLGVSSFAGDEVRFAPIGASLSSASLTSATLTMSGLTGLDLARADVATADPAPQSYCTAGTGGNGCQAHVSSSGRPSVSSADEFFVTFIGVEGQRTGVVFYGTSGPHAAPWAPGSSSFLCVKAPTQRTGSQSSGGTTGACDGALAFSWHDYWPVHSTALGAPFVPGEQLYFQAWYRDPTAVKTTSLSDGLEVTLQP